jgi:DNA-binding transcriptional LysR family regulator
VHLELYVGNRERVLERLRTHQADLGIGGRPPAEGGVQATPFLANPTVVITRAGGSPGRRAIPLAELSEVPWLVREEGSGTRAMTEELLAVHGLTPPMLTLGSNGAIKQGVRAGLGVSLQSRLAADPELGLGLIQAVRIREALPARHWHVLRAERGPLRPAADDFARFLLGPHARGAIEAAHRPASR